MSHILVDSIHIFFFNDTATTEIYTLSLHDALPISISYAERSSVRPTGPVARTTRPCASIQALVVRPPMRCSRSRSRSEEHTSELQSQSNLVCRLLLEKKKDSSANLSSLSSYA